MRVTNYKNNTNIKIKNVNFEIYIYSKHNESEKYLCNNVKQRNSNDQGSGVRFPAEARNCSLLHRVVSYPVGTGGYFPVDKGAGT